MRRLLVPLLLLGLACAGGPSTPPVEVPAAPEAPAADASGLPAMPVLDTSVPYLEARAGWKTRLVRAGPSPEKKPRLDPPAGVKVVAVPGPGGELPAWLALPQSGGARVPVVVYAHPDYAFELADFERCVPFLQSGFAVMLPTWRGENGNPGRFEMFGGEVDDLEAAVRAVSTRKEIDPKRVYVFGHGAGGQLAALLSLRPGLPVVVTASVGALYRTEDFFYWAREVPFDLRDPLEIRMRLLYPNLSEMRLGHIAYVGEEDTTSGKAAPAFVAAAREVGAPLRVEHVRGDERSSLGPAMAAFMESLKVNDVPRRDAP